MALTPSNRQAGNSASSARLMLGLLAGAKTVLDFGCAGPTVSAAMVAAGFDVTTVSIDKLAELVAGEEPNDQAMLNAFDAAMLGDLPERVRDPHRLLEQTRGYLAPDGIVVMVLPNLKHATMRLALLAGTFDFRPRLFTLESARALCARAGYEVTRIERSKHAPVLDWNSHAANNETVAPEIDHTDRDPEDETVQFILQVKPMSHQDRLKREIVFSRDDGMDSDELRSAYEGLLRERDLLAAELFDRTRAYNETRSDNDALRRQLTSLRDELSTRLEQTDTLRKTAEVEANDLRLQITLLTTNVRELTKNDLNQREQIAAANDALATAIMRERELLHSRRAADHDVRAQLAEVERLLEHVQAELDTVRPGTVWQIAAGVKGMKTRFGKTR